MQISHVRQRGRFVTIGLAIAATATVSACSDRNAEPTYGETGLPKNCRAIIAANIAGWKSGAYTPEEALGSIDRNCGENGYSWQD